MGEGSGVSPSKKVRMSVTVSEEFYADVTALARKYGETTSGIVRRALVALLREEAG